MYCYLTTITWELYVEGPKLFLALSEEDEGLTPGAQLKKLDNQSFLQKPVIETIHLFHIFLKLHQMPALQCVFFPWMIQDIQYYTFFFVQIKPIGNLPLFLDWHQG